MTYLGLEPLFEYEIEKTEIYFAVLGDAANELDEAVQYFGIGEKKIRMLISENTDTDYCFTVQIGNKSLINRHKFEEFLNQTTSL